jgi:UPF0716 family protein affecting phage T7 exclusion
MTPETRIRAARVLIPIGVVIGVVAAVIGVWWTVAAMVLVVAGQILNLRASRRRLDGRPPTRFLG